MQLRNLRIRTRLLLGFGLMMAMIIILVGIGAFGLNVSTTALRGITQELIPANNIAAGGRAKLIESEAATATMVASIFNDAEMKAAKARWDQAQVAMNKAMDDFDKVAKTDTQKDNLKTFRNNIGLYRQAVEPVAAKLLSSGYADAKEALEDMKKADVGYAPAMKLLVGIEVTLADTSSKVFAKVDGVIGTIFAVLIAPAC